MFEQASVVQKSKSKPNLAQGLPFDGVRIHYNAGKPAQLKTAQRVEFDEEEEFLLQGKFSDTVQREALDLSDLEEEELLQGKFSDTAQLAREGSAQGSSMETGRANMTGIPDGMKTRFEGMSGFSFDDVQVHYNSNKPAQLNAMAYTQGNQVYIGPGQEKHLGHELGHVVQQKEGRVKPTMQLHGVNVNDNAGLEREADRMGHKI